MKTTSITVSKVVNVPVRKVWESWTAPQHIVKWNNASADWHTPFAENDLRTGGRFKSTMAAKDGSHSFDFEGTYTNIEPLRVIEYVMDDGRDVRVTFDAQGEVTLVTETFDADATHPADMQQAGWQSILDNFKKYTEAL